MMPITASRAIIAPTARTTCQVRIWASPYRRRLSGVLRSYSRPRRRAESSGGSITAGSVLRVAWIRHGRALGCTSEPRPAIQRHHLLPKVERGATPHGTLVRRAAFDLGV